MAKAVFGLVDTESQAERIVDSLKTAGFPNNDISVLFPDKGGTRDFAHEQNTKAPEGAATGAGVRGGCRWLHWRCTRMAGGHWFPCYPRPRTFHCRRADYGRVGGSRRWCSGWWAFGRASWNGYSRVGS